MKRSTFTQKIVKICKLEGRPLHCSNSESHHSNGSYITRTIKSITYVRILSHQGESSDNPRFGTFVCMPNGEIMLPAEKDSNPCIMDPHIMENYPVVWQGSLVLKNGQAIVQMHYISGNKAIAEKSLPLGENERSLRILKRMRFEPQHMKEIQKKIELPEEHCVLMALPSGKDSSELYMQSRTLDINFIQYFDRKAAAGIIHVVLPGSEEPAYLVHVFSTCEFTNAHMARTAPQVFSVFDKMTNLVIIILKCD
ncbi:protein split ends [Caerostris darwini]|uniref:Protein split ends n=1 Tax=Caerostris darwini TaxID=1538125 RepID=A0AAV4USH2_9ARAC|nr:protein split ends [Caerostris darwini]